jgi:hypothetical protein
MTFLEPPKMPDATDRMNLLVSQINQQIVKMMEADIAKIINGTIEYQRSQTIREAIQMRDSVFKQMANDMNQSERAEREIE